MPRFGAIDIGSNAFRLRIVEADGIDAVREIGFTRAAVRLGQSVFLSRQIPPAVMVVGVAALGKFREAMNAANVERYRAVATSALRSAENRGVFVERARREAGIEVEVIDGAEEARLERIAVTRCVPLEGRRSLLLDLGGGSLEATVMEGQQPTFSASVNVGTVRLLEAFVKGGGPIGAAEEELLVEYIDRMLLPVTRAVEGRRPDVVIGTGGNLDTMAELCPARTSVLPGETAARLPSIDVSALRQLLPTLAATSADQRQVAFGLRPDRADVLVPAIYVILRVVGLVGAEAVLAPGVGLKDGLIAELVREHFHVSEGPAHESALVEAALVIGRRYRFDEGHGLHVARLSLSLYDQLSELHGLELETRAHLRLASLLHDVGDFINYDGHHKHSQYILESTDIMGLAPGDRLIVANLVRYHRGSHPSTEHPSFKRLDRRGREIVTKLAPILRVADALDREHCGKITAVRAKVGRERVLLELDGSEDVGLELWTVERKADLFEKVYHRRLRVGAPSPAPPASVETDDDDERRPVVPAIVTTRPTDR